MTKRMQVYKCEVCGNIVLVLHEGVGELVCCGQPMTLMDEQTADMTTEKHVPVVESADGGVKVKVGSVPHPMTDEHYIEWVELEKKDGTIERAFLKPGDPPEFVFTDAKLEDVVKAREYCNIHKLWKNEL